MTAMATKLPRFATVGLRHGCRMVSLGSMALVSAFCAVGGDAYAAAGSTTVGVATAIPVSCTVTTTSDMLFASNIVSTTGQSYDAQGSFDVTCTVGGSFGLSVPVSGQGSGVQRRMYSSSAGAYLMYDVFASSADRSAGGPLYNTAPASTGQTTTGSAQSFTLYGRIPMQATTPPPGTYTDTLTITVGY